MWHFICDMCGKGLLVDEDVRYEVTVEIKSAYDPMEITEKDLQQDHIKEMNRLIRQMKDKDPQELQDEVYRVFKFDLCRPCQKKLLKNPLLNLKTETVD